MQEREFEISAAAFGKELLFFFVLTLVCGVLSGWFPVLKTPLLWAWWGIVCIRVFTWAMVLLIPIVRTAGGMVIDFISITTTLYNVTIRPVIHFCILLYNFFFKREFPFNHSHSQGDSSSGNSDKQQEEKAHTGNHKHSSSSDDAEEERFRRRQEQRRQEEQRNQQKKQRRSCFDVLGITPDTDLTTAKKAYKELLKKYHPDRVNDLGPELRDLANEKLKEINTAWEEFQALWAYRQR